MNSVGVGVHRERGVPLKRTGGMRGNSYLIRMTAENPGTSESLASEKSYQLDLGRRPRLKEVTKIWRAMATVSGSTLLDYMQ